MSSHSFTIRQSVIVCKPREVVWDYTQDFNRRVAWDPAIHFAEILQPEPDRIVKVKALGNTIMNCHFKHYERPHKSDLLAREISSSLIASAEGSWAYDKIGKGTLWSQTHTIQLKYHPLNKIRIPFYKWYFKKLTRQAMHRARIAMEKSLH